MDTNLKIIQLVETRPILYARCNNFAGRSQKWKEIADILKVDVDIVKSRWHLLRNRFIEEYSSVLKGNTTSFKYLNEMSFLTDHINLSAFELYSKENASTVPEFNITKQDVEEMSNIDSPVEFIELQLDDESQKEFTQIQFEEAEETSQNEYVEPIYVDEYSKTSPPSSELEKTSLPLTKSQPASNDVEMFIEIKPKKTTTDKPEIKQITTPEKSVFEKKSSEKSSDVKGKTQIVLKQESEEIKSPTTVDEKNKSKSEDVKPEAVPSMALDNSVLSKKTENYRCEDTIFGELVTATLREMNSEKKKTVKREIMNLLFT